MGDTGAVVGPSGAIDVGDCSVAAGYVLHVGTAAPGASVAVGDEVTVKVGFVMGYALVCKGSTCLCAREALS